MGPAIAWAMAEAASAHQAATATDEDSSQQRAGRRRGISTDLQRVQQGATVAAAAAPAAQDSLSRLQHLADASPRVAQLRRLQELADSHSAPVSQLAGTPEEEDLIQGKFATAELQPQRQQAPRANNTGLPDQLKSGLESLSGLSMDHVRVHYNSSQPAQLNALAYAQGSEIHVAPGQEQHLPHEAWHVVQQAQGRVLHTEHFQRTAINDDPTLEREADTMGARATITLSVAPVQRWGAALPHAMSQHPVVAPVVQRARLLVKITGVTHLVTASHGSIMEGSEYQEVSEGQNIMIETRKKLRSRRGPNQEVHRIFDLDRDGRHDYRWFQVLSVDGKEVPPHVYLRDATFLTSSQKKLGARDAIIKGHGRDRMRPAEAPVYKLATDIICEADKVPNVDDVYKVVNLWSETNTSVHDPLKTLRFMQIAYAFGDNQSLRLMLSGSIKEIDQVKSLCTFLERSSGFQFVQSWSESPANDVLNLTLAWIYFVQGIKTLKGSPKLGSYLGNVLDHDKGYAQTMNEAVMAMLVADEAPTDDRNFDQVLQDALSSESNTSIWGFGMVVNQALKTQLERESMSPQTSIAVKVQEENMWDHVITALWRNAPKHLRDNFQQCITTIEENNEQVFKAVRKIVPISFELKLDYLNAQIDKAKEFCAD